MTNLRSIVEIEQARLTVRPGSAQDRRLQAELRCACLKALGMLPEDPQSPYAATTGELRSWAMHATTDVGRY